MDEIAISKFKATCLAALERVRRTGRPLLVTRRGEPVAQILPPPEAGGAREGRFGYMKGTAEVHGDIVGPVVDPEEWDVLR
jgi:prevent-host-death family protein